LLLRAHCEASHLEAQLRRSTQTKQQHQQRPAPTPLQNPLDVLKNLTTPFKAITLAFVRKEAL
jgi:hypothetical protein